LNLTKEVFELIKGNMRRSYETKEILEKKRFLTNKLFEKILIKKIFKSSKKMMQTPLLS
jgi:hypothetical protein